MGARSGRKRKRSSKSKSRIKASVEKRYKKRSGGFSQEGLNVLK